MFSRKTVDLIKKLERETQTIDSQIIPKNLSMQRQLKILDTYSLLLINFPTEGHSLEALKEYEFFGQFKNIKTIKQITVQDKNPTQLLIQFSCQLSACFAFLVILKVNYCVVSSKQFRFNLSI